MGLDVGNAMAQITDLDDSHLLYFITNREFCCLPRDKEWPLHVENAMAHITDLNDSHLLNLIINQEFVACPGIRSGGWMWEMPWRR